MNYEFLGSTWWHTKFFDTFEEAYIWASRLAKRGCYLMRYNGVEEKIGAPIQ